MFRLQGELVNQVADLQRVILGFPAVAVRKQACSLVVWLGFQSQFKQSFRAFPRFIAAYWVRSHHHPSPVNSTQILLIASTFLRFAVNFHALNSSPSRIPSVSATGLKLQQRLKRRCGPSSGFQLSSWHFFSARFPADDLQPAAFTEGQTQSLGWAAMVFF